MSWVKFYTAELDPEVQAPQTCGFGVNQKKTMLTGVQTKSCTVILCVLFQLAPAFGPTRKQSWVQLPSQPVAVF